MQVIFSSCDSGDYEVDICVNFSLGCYMDLSVRDLPKPSMSVLVKLLTSEMWTRDTLIPVLQNL